MRPPRERPRPWRAEPPPPFSAPPRRADAPARSYCPPSAAGRAAGRRGSLPRSVPPGSPPTARRASSAGTGDRRSTTSRTLRAGRARRCLSARSRTRRRARGDGRRRGVPAARGPHKGTARRRPTRHPTSHHAPSPAPTDPSPILEKTRDSFCQHGLGHAQGPRRHSPTAEPPPASRPAGAPSRAKVTPAGAVARNEALRASRCLGRAVWRRWSGELRRRRVETRMHRVNLLGRQPMARDFDRQVGRASRPRRRAERLHRAQHTRHKTRGTSPPREKGNPSAQPICATEPVSVQRRLRRFLTSACPDEGREVITGGFAGPAADASQREASLRLQGRRPDRPWIQARRPSCHRRTPRGRGCPPSRS